MWVFLSIRSLVSQDKAYKKSLARYEKSVQGISTRWTLCKNINFVQNRNIKWNLSIQPYRKYDSILFLSGSPITFRILLPNSDARILKKTKSFAEQLCLVFCTGSYMYTAYTIYWIRQDWSWTKHKVLMICVRNGAELQHTSMLDFSFYKLLL